MVNKLTFKRGPKPTGLYAVGNPYTSTDIKLNKVVVGFIAPPSSGASLRQEPNWRVWTKRRKEVTRESPCPFTNVCFTAKFDSEQAARDWVTRNAAQIIAIGLYQESK